MPSGRSAKRAKSGPETVRLRIGNLGKAVLVTGQAYQDPKDALNEFVSNAADEYVQSGRRGERIRVVLRRKGAHRVIAVDDCGAGMSPDRLREVARNLFESNKAGDDRVLGEKAIGILAFQQLGGGCDIVSRAAGSSETWALRLSRGKPTAALERERRRTRDSPGTTVYLSDLDPDVLRLFTQRKVVDYLRTRRGAALARGDYAIEVVEGRTSELVTPEKPDGVRLDIGTRTTLWGKFEFSLFVTPADGKHRRVAVVGRAGTTIVDDIAELDEFAAPPWTSDQVSGQIVFEALQQSAGRRAILRDRDVFPVFFETVRAVEPAVQKAIERVAKEVDAQTADRIAETLRKVFGKVLKELADLDNPMRTPIGSQAGVGALFHGPHTDGELDGELGAPRDAKEPVTDRDRVPDIDELVGPPRDPVATPASANGAATPEHRRPSSLPSVAPDPEPSHARSRFDPVVGIVFYNDRHGDYLLVKDDEAALLDYLATLIAKEYVVYNNPRVPLDEFSEEMVRMLVRVRRHLPRRK